MHLPRIEVELPTTGRIMLRNSYTDQDARDIGAAMEKVAPCSPPVPLPRPR